MRKRIKRKLPEIGTVFVRTYKAWGEHRGRKLELKVVKTGRGIGYEFNGNVYRSPSAAAKSLLHYEINGWTFWKMD